MHLRKTIQRVMLPAFLCAALIGTIGNTVAAPLSSVSVPTGELRSAVQSGVQMERSRQWLNAIGHYEETLKQWPESKDLKYGLRRSKIHFSITRRYDDRSFETKLLRRSRRESFVLFDDVLNHVLKYYVNSLTSTSFVAHGTESFYLALVNRKFLKENLQGVSSARIKRMRMILREQFWNKSIAQSDAARQTVERVCDIAGAELGLSASAVVMEYVFGGCNALDDYSSYLTPDRLDDLYGNIEGEFVGLGIEMKSEIGKGLHLVNVIPESPAQEGGLKRGGYIVSIDGIDCRNMTTDEAARLLRGPSGSRIHLQFRSASSGFTRSGEFVRRAVQVKSIPVAELIDPQNGIGYIQMNGFQKTSASELDAAISKLQKQGMRAMIWDLRGNPGGLLTAAVEVLDRFIDDGVLVSTKGRTSDQNWSYSAHRPGTSNMDLVLLVDENSASASEIVAGAIHDYRRGTIVGRRTYGKWSVQSIFPVRGSTGLRLTTAKFYSPHGRTLGHIGLRPDYVVQNDNQHETYYRGVEDGDLDADKDVQKGLEILRRQISRR